MPDAAANYAYWQQNGQFWVEEYQRRRANTARYGLQEIVLATIVDANLPARVLEFGCGVGRHLSYLSGLPDAEVHGVDQSPTMLAGVPHFVSDPAVVARARLIEPLGRLPHADREFDIVFSAEVLIHVRPEDLDGRLAELVRVCRGSLLHLEPPADYVLAAAEHDGCWYHDLVAAYARLGLAARRIGRPVEAQELVVVDLDPARPLRVPGAAMLRHVLEVEASLQPGTDRIAPAVAVPSAVGSSEAENTHGVGDEYFPTQRPLEQNIVTITDLDRKYGASVGPVPTSARVIPPALKICVPLANEEELKFAAACRLPFQIEGYQDSYMHDIIRAFRLISGRKTYLEVGTFDRGNLAYVARLLADDALLIGVDMQEEEDRDRLLRSQLKPGQTYISVVGDSRDPATVANVQNALRGHALDAVFIDGGHTAHTVMCDYVSYGELVAPNGLVMFHDSMWEGNDTFKGTADALAEIDRFDPIYLVNGVGAPHRFIRPMWRDEIWGVVGVHLT